MRKRLALVAVVLAACGDDPNGLRRGATSGSDSSSASSSSSGGTSGSSGDPSASSSSGAPGGGAAANACVATINAYRKQQGLPAYAEWTDAEGCSDGEAKSDGTTKTAHGAFPRCGEFAQNECPGWPGPPETGIPKCLDQMWSLGPGEGHHDNMASRQWTRVACGFYTLADGTVWSVQNFR